MNCVGINLLYLIPGGVGGTQVYAENTITTLLKEKSVDKSYIVFCPIECEGKLHFTEKNVKIVICPIHAQSRVLRIMYEQCIFPFLIARYHCNQLLSFGYIGPIFGPFEKQVTVHDANWLDCPEDVSTFSRVIQSIIIPLCMLTANTILTDSVFSYSRLEHYFPIFKSKTFVVPLSVSSKFKQLLKLPHPNPLKKQRYILCVSAFYHHKRIPYLLTLFSRIQRLGYVLVLIGKNGNDEQIVEQRIRNSKNIIHIPSVTLETLVSYYQHASAFISPSIYEGFGYPVYEALEAKLLIFVGKTELYKASVQSSLIQLHGNIDKDEHLLKKTLHDNV